MVAVEATDNIRLGLVMTEVAKIDEPADPAVGALAASWAATVTTEEF